ncbi:uncharacterized protein LOC144884656 [Branchiostoma floridae x Branchiostoma japonicum]
MAPGHSHQEQQRREPGRSVDYCCPGQELDHPAYWRKALAGQWIPCEARTPKSQRAKVYQSPRPGLQTPARLPIQLATIALPLGEASDSRGPTEFLPTTCWYKCNGQASRHLWGLVMGMSTVRSESVMVFQVIFIILLVLGNIYAASYQSCPNGWLSEFGKCFHISGIKCSWGNARGRCRNIHADLASPTSGDQQAWLGARVTGKRWIGLTRAGETWRWNNGYSLTASNWREGEPNDSHHSEDCVEVWDDGKWNDEDCWHTDRGGYICERRR